MRFLALTLAPALAAATPILVFPGGHAPRDVPTDGFASPEGLASPSSGSGSADGPNPGDIQILSASFSGNGCPQGSVSTSISPDKTVRRREARVW